MSFMNHKAKNVLGGELKPCCYEPMTGYFRDGFCRTDNSDYGNHTVCVIVNDEFLTYSKAMGNDLSTPFPEYKFPGLKQGDKWCLCAARWQQAFLDGFAPDVVLESTHENCLENIMLEDLKSHSYVS